MIQDTLEFEVPRAPEDVFAFFRDIERLPAQVPALRRVTRRGDGPVAAGAEYDVEVERNGKVETGRLTVTAFLAPSRLAYEASAGPGAFGVDVGVMPSGEGSRVRLAYSVQLKGLARMAEPLVRGWIKKNAGEAAVRLRREIRDFPAPPR
jgi:carbon monoxide dehydrogenase subunit G